MAAAAAYMTDSWYPTAQTDDSNRWITGRCWLYCRRQGVRVTWVGPACTPNGSRPMYACESCIAEIDYMVRDEQQREDLGEFAPGRRVAGPPLPSTQRPAFPVTGPPRPILAPAPPRPPTARRRPGSLSASLRRVASRLRWSL